MAGGTITSDPYVNLPPNAVADLTINIDNRATHIFTMGDFTQAPYDPLLPNPNNLPNNVIDVVTIYPQTPVGPTGEIYYLGVLQNTSFDATKTNIDLNQLWFEAPNVDPADEDLIVYGIANVGLPGGETVPGVITMEYAALPPQYKLINVEHSAVSANEACTVPNDAPIWIPIASTFINTTEMWFNSDGTGTIPAGWYSDTIGTRTGDGADNFGVYTPCPISTLTQLKFLPFENTFSNVEICGVVDAPYYLPPGETFETSTEIWDDSIGTIATDGLYSDGIRTKEFRGSVMVGPIYGCSVELSYSTNVPASACNAADFAAWFLFPFGEDLDTATDMYAQWVTAAPGVTVPTGVPDAVTWYAPEPVGPGTGNTVRFWTDDVSKFTITQICV
jgi:hypothetical protein